jgi:hypothetical protein
VKCAGWMRFRASLVAMRRTSWIDQRINDGVAMLVWSTSHVHEVLNLCAPLTNELRHTDAG